jgi:hypothetical protein
MINPVTARHLPMAERVALIRKEWETDEELAEANVGTTDEDIAAELRGRDRRAERLASEGKNPADYGL